MDLQPSAPYASASSFPSPTQLQMNTDPLLSLETLHDFCQGGSASSASTAFPKFPFPHFSSSSKAGIGIDLNSELFSASTTAATWGAATAPERIRSSTAPYFSPNKIAYKSPSAVGGTDCSPPALPSPLTSGSSALQGILQRCGLGSTNTLDLKHNKNHHQQDSSARPATSACITRKIRNLDEILRNLDHYSMSKRFTMTAKKEITEPMLKKSEQWPEADIAQGMSSEKLPSNADHSSATLGGSQIPDGITHINKSISRMEFRAQMEKLTGIIDDRWPGDRRVERVERVVTKTQANVSHTHEPSFTRNLQEHPQVKEDSAPQLALTNAISASGVSTNVLEEMMRNVIGLERRLAKRDRSKQTKMKGFLARGRLWVQRPVGKKMAAMLQKQFRRHAASINQRLDKTDLAIKSLRRQRQDLSPYFTDGNYHVLSKKERKASRVSCSSSNVRTGSLNDSRDISSTASEKNLAESRRPNVAEKCMEACEALSRSMEHIQDQLCTLQRDSQQMGQSLEKIQKQSSEQSMEIELCWTAINHLCIDNETFREELQAYQSDNSSPI
ncbi:unnamed protein product [Calypogeia fissa]